MHDWLEKLSPEQRAAIQHLRTYWHIHPELLKDMTGYRGEWLMNEGEGESRLGWEGPSRYYHLCD